MNGFYSPDRYDRYLTLKVPFTLMLIIFYGIRHLFIIFLAFNPSPKFGEAFAFLQPLASPYFVFSDLPAMLVMVAWIRRAPQAGGSIRWIWRRGRLLLSVSLLLQFMLLIFLEGGGVWSAYFYGERERMVIVSLGLNLLALYYLWRGAMVGDVFADFPSPEAAAGEAGSRPASEG
jgi:hypothetical protein